MYFKLCCMIDFDVFSSRDMRNNPGKLFSGAKNNRMSILTKNGSPKMLTFPFTKEFLEYGINKYIAIKLFESNFITLSKAANIADITIEEFLDITGEMNIDVVKFDSEEIESDIKNIL